MKKQEKNSAEQIAMRVSVNSILVNLFLSFFKLLAGVVAHSGAMISDGVHSASDVLSTFIVILGVKISAKASDENHQYGHERLECVAAILLSVFLALTGVGIGVAGVQNIVKSMHGELVIGVPGILALSAAVISVIIKEGMYWYTRKAAKTIRSSAMMADAWHHRSDALSSVGSFIGILGARLGYPVLDPIASIVICVFIIKAAAEIFIDAVRKMTDEACDSEIVERMKEVVLAQDGVLGVDLIKTRVFGPKIYVDVEISADGNHTLDETHAIAVRVHNSIEKNFMDVKHCMVHVNPYKVPVTEEERRKKLQAQMDFVLELDRVKAITRQTYVTCDGERQENDAEHSWHLAVMCAVLSEYAGTNIDLARTMTMVLMHDVVEIDAGDTYAYDEAANATREVRERAAAERIYGMLPPEQGKVLRELWEEFEARETPEAKFANTLDKVQPILLNHATGGRAWREHQVTREQILTRNRNTWEGSEVLWRYAEAIIEEHVESGDIRS